jgi:hypothetical protein
VPRASGLVFIFRAPALVFGGTEGVGSRFHVLRYQTHFRLFRGRLLPFSCFARPDSFSAVLRASSPVFMICASGLIFGGTKGVPSHLHVFGGTEVVGTLFHVLRSRTCFWRYRGRRVPFSCFALSDSFSVVSGASGPVFMFCALGLAFGGTDGVGSLFHVLRARTRFRRYRGLESHFLVLRSRTRLRRY